MRRLAPYQNGIWLAEYINSRCQLCRVHRCSPKISNQSLLSDNYYGFSAQWRARLNHIFRVNNGLLCSHCHEHINWLPTAFNVDVAAGLSLPIQAATYYDYPIRQVIAAFKQHEDITKLPLLVHALRQLPRPHGCHAANSVIIPMPTTHQRLIKRGFDPVTILSAYLSQHWQIPLWHGAQRVDNTASQQGLSRAERLTNLDNAFMLTEPPPVKHLLLFDDVATTGASLQALAQAVSSSASAIQAVATPTINAYHITAYAIAHGSHP